MMSEMENHGIVNNPVHFPLPSIGASEEFKRIVKMVHHAAE